MKKIFIVLLSIIPVTGCSIKQTIDPAELHSDAKVCVINNPKIKDGFLVALENALESKKIKFKTVERDFNNPECEWKITYTANWAWDLALYMTYAKISVYHNDELDGKAEYDSRNGGGRLDKFINADEKVRELVEKLILNKQAFYLNSHSG